MNETIDLRSFRSYANTQLADRFLSIYSLILILIGTPCNLLCCLIYFQKANRSNSIKTIFGYLAILDTIVLYTFNLNYVVREFNIDYQLTYYKEKNSTKKSLDLNNDVNINIVIIKKNLEEYSLFICRFLSYLGKEKVQYANQTNYTCRILCKIFVFSFSFFHVTNIILGISFWFLKSLFINLKINSI
jgi:hypothetical protein